MTSLLALAGSTLLATVVVFFFGYYVGKGVAEQRLTEEQRVVRLPVTAAGEQPKGEVDVTFYDTLGKSGAEAAPLPEPTGPAEAEEKDDEEVAFVDRPVSRAEPLAEPTAAAEPTPAAAAAEPERVPAVAKKGQAAAPTPAAGAQSYLVQVNAMGDRTRADQLADKLKKSGYRTYVSPAVIGGRTLYRVRVGDFTKEAQARDVVGKLRGDGYKQAFLVAAE
ncbi:MAG: DedD protein [Candidatus Binatota bacterium]|nr:DedD protein [Candidatus Binatota bacterium]